MSENGGHAAPAPTAAEDGKAGMPMADVNFLVECLKNTTDGSSIIVDTAKVATALGYANPRSVGNKISLMKKKYDIPFGGSSRGAATPVKAKATPDTSASKKASDAKGPNEPAVPETPSKKRVAKPRATSTKKAAASKAPRTPNKNIKSAKKVTKKNEYESENEDVKMEDEEEEAENEEDLAVKSPPTPGRRTARTDADAFGIDPASGAEKADDEASEV